MSRAAQVSVSVLEGERSRGPGRRLMGHAVDLASDLGAGRRAEFFFAPGNRALARLAGALGGRVEAARGYAVLGLPRTA
jgi:GNAT superfamily N-acetyltransferase